MSFAISSPPVPAERRRVVFVGTGHAHLYALKKAADFTRRGFEVVAISPGDFWYSGLATGVLGGHYDPEQDQVSIKRLIGRAAPHAAFLRDRVVSIDPVKKCVELASGAALGYDVLSLNVGSETQPIPGEDESVFPIKPLRNLWRLRQTLEKARNDGQKLRAMIAGGGASGCEIAANVRALLEEKVEVVILAQGRKIVPAFPPRLAAALLKWLQSRNIYVRLNSPVSRLEGKVAVTKDGARHSFDVLVNATGLRPPTMIAEAGLPVGDRGELLVDDYLRSTGDPNIFGGGDCVHLRGRALASIGVYAVREAPILFHNLLATLEGRPLRAFRPQRHYLLILNLGDGIGLACWRRFYWLGRTVFWIKDRLDRAFLARYQKFD
jgi:NADH dehydrogenase FAD-containing subunit